MTNKEAYEILDRYKKCSDAVCPPVSCNECPYSVKVEQFDEAFQVALEALQEPKQPDSGTTSCINPENMHVGTTDDLISRRDAIKAVSRGCWELRGIFAECEKNLNELLSVRPEQQWIPCSERMPVLDEAVLATTAWNDVTIAWRVGIDEWRIHEGNTNAEIDDLIAWMPFPEPYRAERRTDA